MPKILWWSTTVIIANVATTTVTRRTGIPINQGLIFSIRERFVFPRMYPKNTTETRISPTAI